MNWPNLPVSMMENKKKMRKIIGWIAAVIIILTIVGYNARQEKIKSESGVFTIKAVIPLSGPLSIYAGDLKKGLNLAQQEIDSKYGAGKVKIELEDSASNPSTVISIYQQKIAGNKNQAMIFIYSSTARAIKPLLDGSVISVVTAAAGSNVADADKKLYQITLTLKDMMSSINSFVKDKGVKTASIMYSSDDYGLEGLTTFKEEFQKNSGQVFDEIPIGMTEADFRLQILKALEKNPEVFFVIGSGRSYFAALTQLVSLGYKGIIVTDYSSTWPDFYKNNPDISEHIYSVTSVESDNFQEKYKPLGMNVLSIAPIYDISVILADAYMTTGGDVEKMADYIENLKDYNGALGKLTMQPQGNVHLPTQIVTTRNGELIPVNEKGETK